MPTASARCRVAVVGAATVAAWLAVAAMSASTADAAAVLDGDYGERQYSADFSCLGLLPIVSWKEIAEPDNF